MRLFIAITFDEIIKEQLSAAIVSLRQHTNRGNFTNRDNLHLTLEFIGETSNYAGVNRALTSVSGKEFELKIGGIGFFSRDGGKVCWLGIELCDELTELQKNIHEALIKQGFRLESHPFKPHLTLGREVVFETGFELTTLNKTIPPLSINVKKISLMKSERIAGKLVYTEIGSIRLTS